MSPAALLNLIFSSHRHPSPFEHLLLDKPRSKVITPTQQTNTRSRLVDYLFLPPHYHDTNTVVLLSIFNQSLQLLAYSSETPSLKASICDLAISALPYTSYTNNNTFYQHASSQVHPRRQARQDGAYSRREPGEVCFIICFAQDLILTPFQSLHCCLSSQ
jgi:hypothetical protein